MSGEANLGEMLDKMLSGMKCKNHVVGIAGEYKLDCKKKRKLVQDSVIDYIMDRLDIVRQQKLPEEQILQQMRDLVWNFLVKHRLQHRTTLQILSNAVDRFMTSPRGESRNIQQIVRNVYDSFNKTAACLCAPLPAPDAPTAFCSSCSVASHTACLWGKEARQPIYDCPFCFLKQCLPNRPSAGVLFAGYLNWHNRFQTENRIYVPLHLVPEGYDVELRCVRLSPDHRYTLTWPEHYSLKLGDKFLRSGKPLAANSAQKHRSEEELRLDRHLFSNNQDITCIVLNEKHTPDKTPHFLVVLLVKTTTPEAVEARVERLGVEESKERLREYLSGGGGECEVEGLRVSLQCQYYKGEMGIPVRSKLCTSHYQPFDLKGFLLANWNSKQHWQRWRCPICKKPAYSLQVDLYLLSLIRQHPHASQLTFDRDGEPHYLEHPKDALRQSDVLVDTSNRESIRRENLTKSAIDLEITPPSSCLVKSEEPYRKAAMAISRASNRLMNSELRAVEIIDLEEQHPPAFQEYIEILDSQEESDPPRPTRRLDMGGVELSEEESQLDSCRKRLKQPTSPHPVAPADNPFTYVHLKMTEEESPRREVPVEKLPVSRARRCKQSFFKFKGPAAAKCELKMGDSIRKPLQRCRMVEVEPEGAEIDAVWQLRFRHHFEELEKERASLSSRDKLQELSPSDAVIFSALVADNIRPWKPNQLSNTTTTN